MLQSRIIMGRRRIVYSKDLLLYVILALFLALALLARTHWMIVLLLSWVMCLVVVGRIIVLVTDGADKQPETGIWRPGPPVEGEGRRKLLTLCVVGAAYGLIVACMWGPFAFSSGMPSETAFSWRSDTSTWWDGFLDLGDPMRPFTNLFYQASYLLGKFCGIPGSFVPFQFVYAMLWWARGGLTFLILRRLLGGYDFLCYVVGALVLVHASDGALQWVGQLNQFGYIFWMLLGTLLLITAVQSQSPARTYFWTVAAGLSEGFCLWSYESAVFILLQIPALILLAFRRVTSRFLAACGVWYGVTVLYGLLSIQKYLNGGNATYQALVMRTDWHVSALAGDLLFNIKKSLFYWSWGNVSPIDMSGASVIVLAIAAIVAFAAGGVWLVVLQWRRTGSSPALPPDRVLGILFGVGSVLLVASFPVYLLLSSARGLWRTQFLSGIGTAVVLTVVFAFIGKRIAAPHRSPGWLPQAVCLLLAASVVSFGAYRAVELGSFHRNLWERHRRVMAQIIRLAPEVKPGTLFVLCNVPRANDPFSDSMWLDVALRLAYPGTTVAGFYYRDDGKPAPGNVFKLHGDVWVREQAGFPALMEDAAAGDAVIMEYDNGATRILRKVPPFLCAEDCAVNEYHPETRIIHAAPSPLAVNRYHPL